MNGRSTDLPMPPQAYRLQTSPSFGKHKIRRDDRARSLRAFGDHLEEKLGFLLVKPRIAELVYKQQIVRRNAFFQAAQLVAVTSLFQLACQRRCIGELHLVAEQAGLYAERRHQVRLAGAGIAHQHEVLVPVNVGATGQLLDKFRLDVLQPREIEFFQRLVQGKVCPPQSALPCLFLSGIVFPLCTRLQGRFLPRILYRYGIRIALEADGCLQGYAADLGVANVVGTPRQRQECLALFLQKIRHRMRLASHLVRGDIAFAAIAEPLVQLS